MMQEWRNREAQIAYRVEQLFAEFEGELVREFPLAEGIRSDYLFRTDKAAYLIEVKGVSSGRFLSFATWGQMVMYQKVAESWHDTEIPVVPVLLTNAELSAALRFSFQKSRIPVVELDLDESLYSFQRKLEKVLNDLDLPVPQIKVGSTLQQ
ncbi:MAG: hypothetical protein FJ316_02715 [SAR202 cluster bacterium]|nr:hypothetical protein [SAR202 cluster bacterium]